MLNPETHVIRSGTISCIAGRYYISVLVDEQEQSKPVLNNFGLGIDLGLKDFAICSDGKTYKNINKSSRIRKLEKSSDGSNTAYRENTKAVRNQTI